MFATKKDMNVKLNVVQLTCVTARVKAKVKVKVVAKVGKIALRGGWGGIDKIQCNVCSCFVTRAALAYPKHFHEAYA